MSRRLLVVVCLAGPLLFTFAFHASETRRAAKAWLALAGPDGRPRAAFTTLEADELVLDEVCRTDPCARAVLDPRELSVLLDGRRRITIR